MKHTPGPWKNKWVSGSIHVYTEKFKTLIVQVSGRCGMEEAEANAKLITASPAMYTTIVDFIETYEELRPLLDEDISLIMKTSIQAFKDALP